MKKGILLINLGSPDSPSQKDVKRYLKEFLMDERVIDLPWIVRKFIVDVMILPTRAKGSAKLYSKIWDNNMSPLILNTINLKNKIQQKINLPISIGMRYQNPSIKAGIEALLEEGVDDIFAISLYPQYAMSTTETVVEKIKELREKFFSNIKFDFVPSFYNDESYIDVLAEDIKSKIDFDFDKLLFSYHGIPQRHKYKTIKSGVQNSTINPKLKHKEYFSSAAYDQQCGYVMKGVRDRLGLEEDKVLMSFQSRLGKSAWVKPYTDVVLKDLASKGVKKLAIVAPAFVSDCLETLEELNIENRELFLSSGGEEYHYISCLNDSDLWVNWFLNKINIFNEA